MEKLCPRKGRSVTLCSGSDLARRSGGGVSFGTSSWSSLDFYSALLSPHPSAQRPSTGPHHTVTMSIQNFGKGALRVAKNYTKGYSDVQAKVREATSNDPWGPSGTQMNEIAQMSYNQYVFSWYAWEVRYSYVSHWSVMRRNDFVEIMEMIDKRLNDKGKNWRHVFKVPSFSAYLPSPPLYLILIMDDYCVTVFDGTRLPSPCRLRERRHLFPGQYLHYQNSQGIPIC